MKERPIRHECRRHGCYLKRHVVKFDEFKECFRRNICPSDIDWAVDVDGKFLFMDWKHESKPQPEYGQDLLLRRLSRLEDFTVVLVRGDCETMQVTGIKQYINGEPREWEQACIDSLKERVKKWADKNYTH